MAESLNDKEQLEWFKRHYGKLREPSLTGWFAHLDREERQSFRERLLDPEHDMSRYGEHAASFRRRFLDALTELDLLEDELRPPSARAIREARQLLVRVSHGRE